MVYKFRKKLLELTFHTETLQKMSKFLVFYAFRLCKCPDIIPDLRQKENSQVLCCFIMNFQWDSYQHKTSKYWPLIVLLNCNVIYHLKHCLYFSPHLPLINLRTETDYSPESKNVIIMDRNTTKLLNYTNLMESIFTYSWTKLFTDSSSW